MKISQWEVYRLVKPSKLQLIMIYLLLPKNCINFSQYKKNKLGGIKQITFSSKYKIHSFLNQVYVENYNYEHPSMLFIYKDLKFEKFVETLIFYTSPAYIQSDKELQIKKELNNLN